MMHGHWSSQRSWVLCMAVPERTAETKKKKARCVNTGPVASARAPGNLGRLTRRSSLQQRQRQVMGRDQLARQIGAGLDARLSSSEVSSEVSGGVLVLRAPQLGQQAVQLIQR